MNAPPSHHSWQSNSNRHPVVEQNYLHTIIDGEIVMAFAAGERIKLNFGPFRQDAAPVCMAVIDYIRRHCHSNAGLVRTDRIAFAYG